MMTRGISIALCTYNGARFLEDQLVSLARQTRLPDELVVCDDRSTDGTVDLIRGFGRRQAFPVRMYENEQNLGSTKNFEKAISLCSFDIIALCDQDDVWNADKLARTERAMLDRHLDGVFTDADVVDENLQPLGYTMWQSIRFRSREREKFDRGEAFQALLRRNIATGTTFAFRSYMRDVVLPIPEQWVHDAWIAMLAAATGKLQLLDAVTVKYRQHGGNQIGGIRGNALDVVKHFHVSGSRTALNHEADALEQARQRLRVLGFEQSKMISLLEEKIDHLRFRASLPPKRIARIGGVLSHTREGWYSSYSKGWLSAAKDLVVRAGEPEDHRGESSRTTRHG